MSSHFCLLCEELFDAYTKLPRRLDCSCVYCEQCLKIFTKLNKFYKCQIHKQRSNKLIEDLDIAVEYLIQEIDQGIQQTQLCQYHQEVQKFYCQDDNEIVCGVCTITSHDGHKFISLEQKFQEAKSKIEIEMKALEESMNLEQKIEIYKTTQQSLGRKSIQLREQAIHLQNYFYNQLRQICQLELKNQLEKFYKLQQDNTKKLMQSKSI